MHVGVQRDASHAPLVIAALDLAHARHALMGIDTGKCDQPASRLARHAAHHVVIHLPLIGGLDVPTLEHTVVDVVGIHRVDQVAQGAPGQLVATAFDETAEDRIVGDRDKFLDLGADSEVDDHRV